MISCTQSPKPYSERYTSEKCKHAYVRAFRFLYVFLGLTLFSFGYLTAQGVIKYEVFEKPALGQIQITFPHASQLEGPSPTGFNVNRSPMLPNGFNANTGMPYTANSQNAIQPNYADPRRILQQAEIERNLIEDEFYRTHLEWLNKTKSYREAFNNLRYLNPDSFSLIKTEFAIENAYLDNQISFDKFLANLEWRATQVKQLLKREGLNTKSDLTLNYGIQQLFKRSTNYYDRKTKQSKSIPPFKYEFSDYNGEKDLTNVFTMKLMGTGKGQCLSMPRLYLMLAEQLGAKAWLSLSPQHSYIQFMDNRGRLMNFETTNGNLASNTWLAQSGFITAKAVKAKTYLDTLSQRQLYSQCLTDFLLGYMRKFGYDNFAEQIKQKIISVDSNNMRVFVIEANIKKEMAYRKLKAAGMPKPEDLYKYPEAFKAYQDMMAAMDKVDNMGYQDMPPEAYQQWLQSMEQEKQKQANKKLRSRMQSQIQMLKQMKSTLIKKPKG